MTITYIPLDERPCNLEYTVGLFNNHQIKSPGKNILGFKKKAADKDAILNFIVENAGQSDALVVSLDMLFFGGLLPSRLHNDDLVWVKKVLKTLGELKENKPNFKIYAFQLIMRTPGYSSSDEEPDYYEKYGIQIFNYGIKKHKKELGLLFDDSIDTNVPEEFISDFENRRKINIASLLETLKVSDIFDYFVIPQDDSHEFGYTAIDQRKVISFIKDESLENILIYPGADEVGAALLGRAVSSRNKKVFIIESSEGGFERIPKYEDRKQSITIESQLKVANLVRVDDEESADYIVAFNTINADMVESWEWEENLEKYNSVRDLKKFVSRIKNFKKPVVIADTSLSNGGDPALVAELKLQNAFDNLSGYFAWNTSSNTMGFVFALINSEKTKRDEKLFKRHLVDDFIYQTFVRMNTNLKILPNLGLNYFDLGSEQKEVVKQEKMQIKNIYNKYISGDDLDFSLEHPWNRMFEVKVVIYE